MFSRNAVVLLCSTGIEKPTLPVGGVSGGSVVENSSASAGDVGSIPEPVCNNS